MFPAAGRVAPQPAPGGSTDTATPWPLGNELDHVRVTEHRVAVPGLTRPIRVLQLTDLHLRTLDAWTDALAEQIRPLRADLVAITGDVVTRGWSREAADRVLSAVPDAPLGRYAIMGNWEYWAGAPPKKWTRVVEAHGLRLLRDDNVVLPELDLVGTDDVLAGDPDLDVAFAGLDPKRPKLVLTHSPAIFPRVVRPGVKVVLAGHTHGGQVRLPFAGPFFLPRGSGPYPWGWYEHEGAWMFVSRGIGWSVAPVRWRAPPEIAFIDLVPG
jgi:uncharacterized protein